MRITDRLITLIILVFKGETYQRLCFIFAGLSLIALLATLENSSDSLTLIAALSCLILSLGLSLIPRYIERNYVSKIEII